MDKNSEKGTRKKILEVRNVSIDYITQGGAMRAVEDVSFDLYRGQSLGIVGESGCGKTTLIKSILRLLPKNGRIAQGAMLFGDDKIDLVNLTEDEMRRLQLAEIALVSQSAMNSLNPVYTVGFQIVEGIRAHRKVSKQEARHRAAEVFAMVGLEEKRLDAFPHQLSGGMKQRAIIAMALSLNPSLVIADEPTTALDVVVQSRILRRIKSIQQQVDSSMIFITHDISVVGEICETIMVMYGGKTMEVAPTDTFFRAPYHPYSLGLQKAFPDIVERNVELVSIPGTPPNLLEEQAGCRFHQRCPFGTAKCREEMPPLQTVAADGNTGQTHRVACWYVDQVDRFRKEAAEHATWERVRNRLAESPAAV